MAQTWDTRDLLAADAVKAMNMIADAMDDLPDTEMLTDWAAEEDDINDRCLRCDKPITTWRVWFEEECPKAPFYPGLRGGCRQGHEVGKEAWRIICADGAKT